MSLQTQPQRRVVSFHYTLTDTKGNQLDTSRDSQQPLTFLEGSGQIIPGLERALALLSVGDTRVIEVEAQDAYGKYEQELVIEVPRERLPNSESVAVDDQFQASGPQGESLMFRVIEVLADKVRLDGNHPLAGENLTFDIEITQARAATLDEIAHGHAHGPGGHHH